MLHPVALAVTIFGCLCFMQMTDKPDLVWSRGHSRTVINPDKQEGGKKTLQTLYFGRWDYFRWEMTMTRRQSADWHGSDGHSPTLWLTQNLPRWWLSGELSSWMSFFHSCRKKHRKNIVRIIITIKKMELFFFPLWHFKSIKGLNEKTIQCPRKNVSRKTTKINYHWSQSCVFDKWWVTSFFLLSNQTMRGQTRLHIWHFFYYSGRH